MRARHAAIARAALLVSFVLAGSALAQGTLGYPRLLAGPMLGTVTADAATIWMKVSGEYDVVLDVAEDRDFTAIVRTVELRARKAERYFLQARCDGLEADRGYWYRIRVGGGTKYLNPPWRFRTAPAGPARFRVAFGSCARWQAAPVQPIWDAVLHAEPDLFFWLGDNFYGDSLDPEVLEYEALRQRTVPNLQPLLQSVAQLATWDDHDFGLNDYDRRHPAKAAALEFFGRYWANPGAGTEAVPGVFFRHSYGGVDFFFLDGRYHRDPNAAKDTPQKTMLGEGQLAWLRAGLRQSTSPFKVLVSGSGWSAAKGPGGDSWASYLHERDALFEFIREQGIEGVVLLSGDTHVGELNAIPWSERGGYDFYDLVSSPLAQQCSGSWQRRSPERRIREVWWKSANFGLLEFDMTAEDPLLRFELRDDRGHAVWPRFELRASELRNGASTWRQKTRPKALLQR